MALFIKSYRCAVILRSNASISISSIIKNEANNLSYKRCYHICHRMKHIVIQDGRNQSSILPLRTHLNHLKVRMNRCLSTGVSNESDSKISSNLSQSSTPDFSSISTQQVGKEARSDTHSSESVVGSVKSTESTEIIPELPELPSADVALPLHEIVGEPSFESLGLGGWTPVGIIQHTMEYLHVDCSLPWWMTIALGTIVVRVLIFPLVIISQRNAAKMNNNLPQLQVLQMKMTEARQTGNQLEAARYAQEMVAFMKEKELNPLKNMMVPLAQAPLFISFFLSLRKMAACPVESMKEGGLFWFTDLTIPDQYFLLPIVTSFTMWITIEVGTDSAKLSASNMQLMKYFLRALPVIILPFTVNFPGAVLCYWVCSNFISLGQVAILRIPTVRDYFKIERLIQHNQDSLPMKPKGFTKGFKDSWQNMKITKELEERQRFDEMQFLKAGRGPIQKTYKYDPTKEDKRPPHKSSEPKS